MNTINHNGYFIVLVVILALLMVVPLFGQSEARVALVIGNSNYSSSTVSPLVNPVNDAEDVSNTLQSMGFTVSTIVDGTREQMGEAVDDFAHSLRDADVGLFFFAGHGVRVDGRNYLIPVDVELPNSRVVPFRTIAADEVLASMSAAGAGLNMFFLDACRDNPLPAESRNLQRGLAVVGDRPPETLIVYATQANATADDGTGRNSPFTQALLQHLPTPGLDVYDLYRNVSSEVQRATGGRQRPEQFGNVTVRYSLASGFIDGDGTLQPETPALSVPSQPLRGGFQVDRGDVRVTAAADAVILVDGEEVGSVTGGQSTTVSGIEVGQRKVSVRYADGHTESRSVTVQVDTAARTSFRYGFGSIRVSVERAGTIFIDGQEKGSLEGGQSGALTGIGSGLREVEVQYDDSSFETQKVRIRVDETVSVSFPVGGSIRITTATAGTVFLDGILQSNIAGGGTRTIPDIPPGSRRIEIRYPNGQRENRTIDVNANQTSVVSFSQAWGSLQISTETSGTVFVDGNRRSAVGRGSTVTISNVPVGSRQVEIRYKDGERETSTATVRKDTTDTVNFSYWRWEYRIGDRGPAGGRIFYIDEENEHDWTFLEAAPSSTEWEDIIWDSDWKHNEIGGTSEAVGSGKKNTDIIVSFFSGRLTIGKRAAILCEQLEHGGYSDWFLPSKDELNLMYENLHKNRIGNFADSHDSYYWSSSENSARSAMTHRFSTGSQSYFSKGTRFRVRAIRTF